MMHCTNPNAVTRTPTTWKKAAAICIQGNFSRCNTRNAAFNSICKDIKHMIKPRTASLIVLGVNREIQYNDIRHL